MKFNYSNRLPNDLDIFGNYYFSVTVLFNSRDSNNRSICLNRLMGMKFEEVVEFFIAEKSVETFSGEKWNRMRNIHSLSVRVHSVLTVEI